VTADNMAHAQRTALLSRMLLAIAGLALGVLGWAVAAPHWKAVTAILTLGIGRETKWRSTQREGS